MLKRRGMSRRLHERGMSVEGRVGKKELRCQVSGVRFCARASSPEKLPQSKIVEYLPRRHGGRGNEQFELPKIRISISYSANSVLLWFKICAPRANLMTTQNISDSRFLPPRREERQVRITIFFAAFASLREIFRIFGCSAAALGPSWSKFFFRLQLATTRSLWLRLIKSARVYATAFVRAT